jgi:LruC domain-containing protein
MKLSGYLLISVLLYTTFSNLVVAQTAPSLGAAQSFAVLGSTSVTSTGSTVISGNTGVSPGIVVTGFPPAIVTDGVITTGLLSTAGAAQVSAGLAFTAITLQTSPLSNFLTGKVLGQTAGATTLTPGVYTFLTNASLNSTLILDDGDDPNAVFIFKIGGSLTASSNSKVVMSSGGKGSNVFWQVGTTASIGANSTFSGNIIANNNVTMNTSATTTGRLFSLRGSVILNASKAFAVANEVPDNDLDGVANALDDYPDDATKAYNNFSSPSEGSTFVFEDQWPVKGDFDLNDLVITSKYKVVTNAKNVVVQVVGTFTLLAAGGDYDNAFGVEFPILSGNVKNLTGATLEDGQTKAVIILFKNMHTELATGNTTPGVSKSAPKSYTVTFDVANGPSLNDFGLEYNPFIYNNPDGLRHEVHLPGKTPTTLATVSLFGKSDDNTSVLLGNYYVTKTGLPYAITLPSATFGYPTEGTDITRSYLHFAEWARSGGLLFQDWYSNTGAGYRNASLIYSK